MLLLLEERGPFPKASCPWSRPQPQGMSGCPPPPSHLPLSGGGAGAVLAHPGMPPASILLATVTSVDHTSYCQRFWPRTPPSTVPVCTPTRMSTPVFVFSRTYLPGTDRKEKGLGHAPRGRNSAQPCTPPARGPLGAASPPPPRDLQLFSPNHSFIYLRR